MYVETNGDPAGEPVIFLHGGMVSGWMWTEVVSLLREYHCIVPDLPGVHRSRDTTWESLHKTAQHVVDLIAQQQGKAHLVGLSLGAVVGLHALALAPERIGRAVLSGAVTRPVPAVLGHLNKFVLWLYSNPRTTPLVARVLQIPEEARDAFAETARMTSKETLARIMSEVYRVPLPERLDAIDVPVLAITGEKDLRLTRQSVPELVKLLPNAAGYLAPGVGHQWSAENPALFADVVRAWLRDAPLPSTLLPCNSFATGTQPG